MKHLILSIIFLIISLIACDNVSLHNNESNAEKGNEQVIASGNWDLEQITESGELIAVTLYGPESYYEYQSVLCGMQYLLAERFAQNEGVRLRMETVKDTASLITFLKNGDADLIAYDLPEEIIKKEKLQAAGYYSIRSNEKKCFWSVRRESPRLSEALQNWYSPGLEKRLNELNNKRNTERYSRKKVRSPYLSKEKGIISLYDSYFVKYSQFIGWDWRLLAAQCYQESGFDPEAVSWTGAQGLMQIMPQTAKEIGLPAKDVFQPQTNIEAATNYIRQLDKKFRDIPNRYDRICFILAAYNGGYHHIRDAMRLANKYGANAKRWNDVAPYVLKLIHAQYYNDPVVKYGYMVGTETYSYVYSILIRWNQYKQGKNTSGSPFTPSHATKRNRFSKKLTILQPDEILQNIKTDSIENTSKP